MAYFDTEPLFPRILRWWSTIPTFFPSESPYCFLRPNSASSGCAPRSYCYRFHSLNLLFSILFNCGVLSVRLLFFIVIDLFLAFLLIFQERCLSWFHQPIYKLALMISRLYCYFRFSCNVSLHTNQIVAFPFHYSFLLSSPKAGIIFSVTIFRFRE
jgi:hypothetical protein